MLAPFSHRIVRLRPDGFGVDPAGATADTTADATVQATAADLLLLLYGRRHHDAEGVQHTGDQDLLARWFADSAF